MGCPTSINDMKTSARQSPRPHTPLHWSTCRKRAIRMRSVAEWLNRSLLCATALMSWPVLAAEPHWEYSGEFGPAHWGSMRAEFRLCDRGHRQSPIDIVSARRQSLLPLQFDYRSEPLRVVNDGHTVRVRFGAGSRLLIGGKPHRLQQFHFHIPGGDRLHGEEFPMAMHFLHKGADGRLVSLVVLFRLGAQTAPAPRTSHIEPKPAAPASAPALPAAATPVGKKAAWPGEDRRSPDRAKNVARLPAKAAGTAPADGESRFGGHHGIAQRAAATHRAADGFSHRPWSGC